MGGNPAGSRRKVCVAHLNSISAVVGRVPEPLGRNPADDLAAYLDLIGGDGPGLAEVRYKLPTGRMGQEWFQPREPALRDFLLAFGRRTDTYVGVGLRHRRGGSKQDVAAIGCLWADCDTADAIEALSRFRPPPTMIVRSGTGENCHAYWMMRDTLEAAECEEANRRLAAYLGADMQATDAARIMRPPGTFNHKHTPPALVAVHQIDLELGCYSLEEIACELPEPATASSASSRRRTRCDVVAFKVDPDDRLMSVPPIVYVEALTGRRVGRDGKIQCPFHNGGQERTPSLEVYDTPERGWACFGDGCDSAGGTIIDFGAKLYGVEPRGAGYHEIRRRLVDNLRGRAA